MNNEPIFNTEFEFTLPRGLIDAQGVIHKRGTMRLATAKDEIYVQKDRRTQANSDYGVLVLLARVITRLDNLPSITPELLENLFSLDLAYLREFFNRINQQEDANIPVQCPSCNSHFKVELALSGES
jgi:hypothetical protein